MRILNRPMFRYGGPIKEGIMSGVRSNYAGGRRAALVGDPVFPRDSSGRSHHAVPALAAVPWLLRAASIPFGRWGAKKLIKDTAVKAGSTLRGPGTGPFSAVKEIFDPKKFTPYKFWSKDPLYSTVVGGTSMFGRGIKAAGQKGYQFGKYATTTPSGLAFMGLPVIYMGGKYLLSDGTELNNDQINQITQAPQEGVPGGGDRGMQGTGEWFAAEAQKKLAEKNKAERKAKIAKYMDTMGYDKAKKGAIGDALIDASAIVQAGTEEGGSLKHADWGKMINQAIQATSKRLKKPEQIREAIGLMMTKAEIQKDLTAETDAQAKRKLNLQIKELEAKLNPSAGDIALAMGDKTITQPMLENIVRSNEGVDTLRASFKDEKESAYGKWKDDNKKGDAMKFMNDIVKKDAEFGAGFYVFPKRIVEVKDDLSMSYYY